MDALYQSYLETFSFDVDVDSKILHEYRHSLPIISCALYVLMVHFLPSFIKTIYDKPWYQSFLKNILKPIMIVWNYGLSALSIAMFIGISIPYFFYHLPSYNYSVVDLLCDPESRMYNGGNTMVFWMYLFMLSKFAEFMDTLFLIVKKPSRPVEFLHWYHHTTVLLFTWYAGGVYRLALGTAFASMNSLIHSFMYYYYGQMERGIRPRWGKMLTVGQIAQMFFGILFNAIFAYKHFTTERGCSCGQPHIMLAITWVIYGSYLLLFVQFFVKKYFGTPAVPEKKKQ